MSDYAQVLRGHLAQRSLTMLSCRSKDRFRYLESSHDRLDATYFGARGIGRDSDVWDNRRKVVF